MVRHQKSIARVAFGLSICLGVYPVVGGERNVGSQASAVRQAGKDYIEALNRGDAKALATLWTPDGVYVDATGRTFKAREMIEQNFADTTATENGEKLPVDANSSIRFVTSDVAIEEGTSRSPSTAGEETVTGGYSAIWVKKDDRWLLDNLREWASADVAPENPLDALSWIIGDWVGHGDGSEVTTSAYWSGNRKFILRRFSIEQDGKQVLTGTQRIGWDPAAKSIRSWVFDSDGGIVEGVWTPEDDAWIIKTAGVLADGSRCTCANFLVPEGTDRFTFLSSHVTVDGTPVENSVMEFQRTHDSP